MPNRPQYPRLKKTSFFLREVKENFEKQQTFPSGFRLASFCESLGRRSYVGKKEKFGKEKQMGKVCAVLITFSPSSGPSIPPRNSPVQSPLGEIKFNFSSSWLSSSAWLLRMRNLERFPSLMKTTITMKTQN